MKRLRRALLSTVLVAGALGAASAPAFADPARDLSRGGRATTFSSNWSGYAAYANTSDPPVPVTFSHAEGDWNVPTVDCSGVKGQQLTIATSFVGLDGYFSSTVEQNGTDADCIGNGAAFYQAWYEFYPERATFYNETVEAGDHMHAEVTHSGSTTTVSLEDLTQGWGPLTQSRTTSFDLSSAEWILEAPTSKLSKFSPDASYFNASATGDGTTGGIDSFTNDKIIMVRGHFARATPSTLSGGNAFTVHWGHN